MAKCQCQVGFGLVVSRSILLIYYFYLVMPKSILNFQQLSDINLSMIKIVASFLSQVFIMFNMIFQGNSFIIYGKRSRRTEDQDQTNQWEVNGQWLIVWPLKLVGSMNKVLNDTNVLISRISNDNVWQTTEGLLLHCLLHKPFK